MQILWSRGCFQSLPAVVATPHVLSVYAGRYEIVHLLGLLITHIMVLPNQYVPAETVPISFEYYVIITYYIM